MRIIVADFLVSVYFWHRPWWFSGHGGTHHLQCNIGRCRASCGSPMCKYLCEVFAPTLYWPLLERGNMLFAQCVSWCGSERLPLHMASSIFSVCLMPSVSWGIDIFSRSAPGSLFAGVADRVTQRRRFGLARLI